MEIECALLSLLANLFVDLFPFTIDFIKQARGRGVKRTEAILQAGAIRLGPILMTSLSMIFAMLPLAFGVGPGAEFRAPMAQAVLGGLTSSTILTLIVVPVVYTILDDFVLFIKKRFNDIVLFIKRMFNINGK